MMLCFLLVGFGEREKGGREKKKGAARFLLLGLLSSCKTSQLRRPAGEEGGKRGEKREERGGKKNVLSPTPLVICRLAQGSKEEGRERGERGEKKSISSPSSWPKVTGDEGGGKRKKGKKATLFPIFLRTCVAAPASGGSVRKGKEGGRKKRERRKARRHSLSRLPKIP